MNQKKNTSHNTNHNINDTIFALICIIVIICFAMVANRIGILSVTVGGQVDSSEVNSEYSEYDVQETVYKTEDAELLVLNDIKDVSGNAFDDKAINEGSNRNIDEASSKNYTEEDLMLIAKVIAAEAGSDNVSDRCNELVGAVIVNRVNHESFPNTIEEVIYAPGQYATVSQLDSIVPDERDLENARRALEGEIDCPSDVVWQANFPQCAWGTSVDIYEKIETPYGTMYFCHYGK